MLSNLFLGMALLGAEWVLYILVLISILSIALIIERAKFYRESSKELTQFRSKIRELAKGSDWAQVKQTAQSRAQNQGPKGLDFETPLTLALLEQANQSKTSESLSEIAQDSILQTRVQWEKSLSILATIGSNAPFVGLFGTVLGIIQAFHDLSQKASTGVQTVTAGVSDALIATAVGILVAIPAVVAFNLFQRRVRNSINEAEALKSFLIAKLSGKN